MGAERVEVCDVFFSEGGGFFDAIGERGGQAVCVYSYQGVQRPSFLVVLRCGYSNDRDVLAQCFSEVDDVWSLGKHLNFSFGRGENNDFLVGVGFHRLDDSVGGDVLRVLCVEFLKVDRFGFGQSPGGCGGDYFFGINVWSEGAGVDVTFDADNVPDFEVGWNGVAIVGAGVNGLSGIVDK